MGQCLWSANTWCLEHGRCLVCRSWLSCLFTQPVQFSTLCLLPRYCQVGKNIQAEAHSQCVFLPHDERPLEEIKAQEWKMVFPEEPRSLRLEFPQGQKSSGLNLDRNRVGYARSQHVPLSLTTSRPLEGSTELCACRCGLHGPGGDDACLQSRGKTSS